MYDTYEDLWLLAGQLVARAEMRPNDDKARSMYLLAGFIRGLVTAGEPVNSALTRRAVVNAEELMADVGATV